MKRSYHFKALVSTLAVGFCFLTSSSQAQEVPKTQEDWRRLLGPHPITELPKNIAGDPGRLSLKVIPDQEANKVRLYIINETGDAVSLTSQDGDFYLKREVFVDLDGWHRVQTHTYSDCGNSYGADKLPPKHFFMREGPLNDGADQPEAKVRYRFYTDAHRDIASPVISARVDQAWIDWCRCDAMGLREAPLAVMVKVAQQGSPSLPQRLLEKLESYQRESLTPEGQEWVRMDAIRAISMSKQVFEAMKALDQIVNTEKPKSRLWSAAVEGLCDLQKESLDGWAAWLMKPEQQKRTELVEAHLFRMGFAAVRWAPWHFAEDFDQWLESLISQPSHPLSQSALAVYACGFPQDKHHAKLAALWKAADPGLYREKLLEFVRRVSPHKVLGITQTCPDHRTVRITLTNMSGLPIEFDVPSPRSAVHFSLIEESTNRSFPEKPVEPAQSKRVRLAVGEHLTLPDFALDDLFELPKDGDLSVSLRSQTNLPEFGELPALPNGYNGLRVSNGMFRTLN